MPLAKLGTSNSTVATPARPSTRHRDAAVKKLQLRLSPDGWKRLKSLALDEDTSLEALGLEAFSLLLERRGLPPLDGKTS